MYWVPTYCSPCQSTATVNAPGAARPTWCRRAAASRNTTVRRSPVSSTVTTRTPHCNVVSRRGPNTSVSLPSVDTMAIASTDGPDDGEQHQALEPEPHGVGPLVAGHGPRDVQRVLEGLAETHRAVDRRQHADHGADLRARQPFGPAELVTDDREGAERRVEDLFLEVRVALEDEAEDGRGEQQQREDRDQRVEADDRRQVGPLVVDELEERRDGEAEERPFPLRAVDRVHEPHGAKAMRKVVRDLLRQWSTARPRRSRRAAHLRSLRARRLRAQPRSCWSRCGSRRGRPRRPARR